MTSKVIVALDLEKETALDLVSRFNPNLCKLKVGSELFTSSGPKIVSDLTSKGFEVFLDLKFHDIPNTVAAAVREASQLGAWMVNVHASGGERMMLSAREELDKINSKTLLIAVTVLTSISKNEGINIGINDINDHASNLASLAKNSGLHGVVCSPKEVRSIKEICGDDFMTVTPGIRLSNSEDDQSRVSTPKEAILKGSDFLVIGRPITGSSNPLESLEAINSDINSIAEIRP